MFKSEAHVLVIHIVSAGEDLCHIFVPNFVTCLRWSCSPTGLRKNETFLRAWKIDKIFLRQMVEKQGIFRVNSHLRENIFQLFYIFGDAR